MEQERIKLNHELELAKVKEDITAGMSIGARVPQLPIFQENRDDINVYLGRFERFAIIQKWDKANWAVMLSALHVLTGRALEAYNSMSDNDATDYNQVKAAILKGYNLTEEGFRRKFRWSKPEQDESPEQFATRIGKYFDQWTETAGVTDYETLRNLIIKE